MAARLLSRSKTLSLTRVIHRSLISQQLCSLHHGKMPPLDSTSAAAGYAPRPDLAAAASHAADIPRVVPDAMLSGPLGSQKIWGYEQISPCHLNKPLHGGTQPLPCGAARHHAYNVPLQFYHSTGKNKIGKAGGQIEEVKGADEPDPLNGKGNCSKVTCFSPLEGTSKGRVSGLANESLKIKRSELSQKITYALIPALLIVSKTKLATSLLIFSVFWQIYGFFKEIFLDYIHHEVTREWVLVYFKLLLLIVAKDLFLYFGLG